MTFILIIILFAFIFVFSVWITLAIVLEDRTVPTHSSKIPFSNVLAIYPHPDDECLTSGGLMHILSKRGVKTTLLTMTKGECGTPDASFHTKLAEIRSGELARSAKILGFSEVILEDMGDGKLSAKKAEVKRAVKSVMERLKPDLVISYDRSGLYGHPDHMVLADVITELVAESFPQTTLWYAAFPKFVLGMIKLPTHMAKDPTFMSLHATPTHRIFIGLHAWAKVRSLFCHTSQMVGLKEGLTVKGMPLWFPHSARMFEYYAEVKREA